MRVQFAKDPEKRLVRWDALVGKRTRVPGSVMAVNKDLPHDLAQYVIEASAGTRNGFWGCVAAGATFKSTGRKRTKPGRAVIAQHRAELVESEKLAGAHLHAWRAGERTTVTRARSIAPVPNGGVCRPANGSCSSGRAQKAGSKGHDVHAWTRRERVALTQVAHGRELGGVPRALPHTRHDRARRRMRAGHDHGRHRLARCAGEGRRDRRGRRRDCRRASQRTGTRQSRVRRRRRVRVRRCVRHRARASGVAALARSRRRVAVDAERVQAGRHRRRARQ